MPTARAQNLRVLDGRFVLARVTDVREVAVDGDLLALVLGPDGGAAMRRDDAAEDAWAALWNGDDAHDPQATGMLGAIVAPLAAGGVPVWTAASYDGDLVLVPAHRVDEAVDLLRRAGHRVRVRVDGGGAMDVVRLGTGDRERARQGFALLNEVFEADGEELSEGYLDRLLSDPRFHAWVAVDADEVIGALTAHELPMTRVETAEIFIYDLAVRPDRQRGGVGRALVEQLVAAADPASVSSVFVPADDEDVHALDFYRAVGGAAAPVTIFTFDPVAIAR